MIDRIIILQRVKMVLTGQVHGAMETTRQVRLALSLQQKGAYRGTKYRCGPSPGVLIDGVCLRGADDLIAASTVTRCDRSPLRALPVRCCHLRASRSLRPKGENFARQRAVHEGLLLPSGGREHVVADKTEQ